MIDSNALRKLVEAALLAKHGLAFEQDSAETSLDPTVVMLAIAVSNEEVVAEVGELVGAVMAVTDLGNVLTEL